MLRKDLEATFWAFKNQAFAGAFRVSYGKCFDHVFEATNEDHSISGRVVDVDEVEQGKREAALLRSIVEFARA